MKSERFGEIKVEIDFEDYNCKVLAKFELLDESQVSPLTFIGPKVMASYDDFIHYSDDVGFLYVLANMFKEFRDECHEQLILAGKKIRVSVEHPGVSHIYSGDTFKIDSDPEDVARCVMTKLAEVSESHNL